MKPTTLEWITKAEGDYKTMIREARVRKDPNYDAACFHAQQCAEKYLKARLCEASIEFEKIHDLVALLDMVLPVEPLWESFREGLAFLTNYAVTFRYPGESATRGEVVQCRKYCRSFREWIRTGFVLEK